MGTFRSWSTPACRDRQKSARNRRSIQLVRPLGSHSSTTAIQGDVLRALVEQHTVPECVVAKVDGGPVGSVDPPGGTGLT